LCWISLGVYDYRDKKVVGALLRFRAPSVDQELWIHYNVVMEQRLRCLAVDEKISLVKQIVKL
jgi:hypothetical protein